MRKKILALLLLIGITMQLFSTAAAITAQPTVIFQASAPDENGFFDLTLSVFNASFNTFQFAINYSTDAVQPIKADGTPAEKFNDCAKQTTSAEWLSTLGTALDANKGLIQFSGYVLPGVSSGIVKNGNATADENGLPVIAFRFKLLDAGKAWFRLAAKDSGLPYDPSIPDGGGLAAGGKKLDTKISFELSALTSTSNQPNTPDPDPSAPGENERPDKPYLPDEGKDESHAADLTPEQLLHRSVILQLNNHAAVVSGGVTAIYPGERDISAYLSQDNRTMVPVRFIAEKFGATVNWENTTRTVVIAHNGKTIRMPIGSNTYTVNGIKTEMDTAAVIMHDRTMVPLRFVAQALGFQVEYDPLYRMVIVSQYVWHMEKENERAALDSALSMLITFGKFV